MDNMSFDTLIPSGLEHEVSLHIKKVRDAMPDDSALLVAGNVNIFYCTGRFFRGYIWLPKEGMPLYFVMKPQIYEPGSEIVFIRKPEQIAGELASRGLTIPPKVGIEEAVLPYSDAMRLMKAVGASEYFDSTPCLREARMVKTPWEIEAMKADGIRQARVYSKISSLYRPGMTDIRLQIAIERELRLEGCLGFARVAGSLMEINMGSVLAGDNADNPSPYEFAMGGAGADPSLPGGADGTVIAAGQTVMVDMNGAFNALQTDMTRIWTLGDLPAGSRNAVPALTIFLHVALLF